MGRSSEINEKVKDERRTLILSHALRLFATNGLAATKISHIAAASGMSQGLMYHYYQSKEQIFIELIRMSFERMNQAVKELEKLEMPPREKIRLALEHLLKGLDAHEDTGFYHLLIAQATASDAIPEEAKAIIQKQNRLPYQVISRIIQEGQENGDFCQHDPDELAMIFWTSIKGLSMHKAAFGKKMKMPDPDILMKLFA